MKDNGTKLQRITTDRIAFYTRLRLLHAAKPYSVTSWWRTIRHNAIVGGHPNSLHLEGLAVDCKLEPGQSKAAFLRHAQSLGLHGQVEIAHVHLQALPARKVKP